jgi:hypothetical protein
MNLPSSLALPQSKFLQSRIGILILALVVALTGGALFLVLRAPAPVLSPTPATSPAAQAPVRTEPVAQAPAPVVYGPPAPDWVERVPVPAAASAPGQAVPASAAAVSPAEAATLVPGASALETSAEVPRSLDASVLFARDQYAYTSGGRRDPFQSLIDGKFQGHSGDGSLVDVGDIHLVGIMWGAADKFALVEDSRGRGFVLRVGDPVVNGYISGITKSELQIVQNAFGESQSMSIKLQPKEGDQNATRN